MTATVVPAETTAVPAGVRRWGGFGSGAGMVWLVRLAFIVVVLALWQGFAGGPKSTLPTDVVSKPTAVAAAFWHLVTGGEVFAALGSTALATVYSLLIAIPIGALLALLTAHRFGRWLFEPIITIAYSIPKVGLISLMVILLGVSQATHIVLVTSAVVFVYYFGARQALDELDQNRVIAFRLMGASWWKVARSLVLGYAVPQLFAASRVAVPLAFATEVFAELRVTSSTGLGVLLEQFTNNFDAASAMAVMIFILVLGYLLDVVLRDLLRRYTESIGLSNQL
ncbi:MAG TPA: ABC transporter permease subunit [Pseudonocardiaceae bacterium]|nr:ABC transporter permease subunit [Pseudonocardiaceae bacterium]